MSKKDQLHKLFEAQIVKFSCAKTQSAVDDMKKLFNENLSYADFRKGVKALNLTYNKNYLKTEYATFNNSVLHADEFLEKSTRYKYATWEQIQRTTRRVEHEAFHNKTWLVNEIPAIPPLGWNCGCRLRYHNDATQTIETPSFMTNSEDYKIAKKQGLANNPAKTGILYDDKKVYEGFNKPLSIKNKNIKDIKDIESDLIYNGILPDKEFMKNNYDEIFLIEPKKGDFGFNYIKYYKDKIVVYKDNFNLTSSESTLIQILDIKAVNQIRKDGYLVETKYNL